jgi:anti-sigma B factor antagonist
VNPIEVSYYDTDIAVVTLCGEHDLRTQRQLQQTLRSLQRSGEAIVVDLSEVEFIDSSVLNSFVSADKAARERGTRLTLQVGTESIVHKALEVSGLLQLLPCAPTREEAIRTARNGNRPAEQLA